MSDWMMGGVVENDRDEARYAAHFGGELHDDRPDPSDFAGEETISHMLIREAAEKRRAEAAQS